MAIDTTCPSCSRAMSVDDSFAGRQARCPMCKHVYTVTIQDSPTIQDSTSRQESPASSHSPNLSSLRPLDNSWDKFDPRQEMAPHPGLQPAVSNDSPVLEPLPDNTERLFYIRVPDGQVYGPSNASTLKEWASQGRLNHTCDVRPSNTDIWISYSAWLIQQNERVATPTSNTATRNIYGDNFGGVATPMNQTPVKPSGLGVLICCLGVASWFLCISFIGAPICAVATIIMAMAELKKINEGRSPREERILVHIGLWLSVANLVISFGLMMLFFLLVAISP